ncbi:KRUF family protein [Toxoplasma gondii GT1]|uniref:KRUF family protein n=1 Tax=Toxoplasma gondii (strain ATCC 50853 / GT1) TaxID=507601 RepID=S7UNI6_TOXGG|nr:KRUF family protein [Toxoplasma gondii GT1]
MVAVLFAAGTALATFTCSLELVIYKRTSTNWIPTARALSQNVCVGTLLCVGIAGSFVGVLGARGPHDDDHTKTDTRHHQVTGSESHEETLEELPASRTPTGTGSDGTPEEAAAPKHAVPVQGVSSPGRQSHYRGSRREGAAGIFRRETGSASASDAAENVGLAHMVSMPGRGEVPYGWLAIELLRKEASQLRALWGNEKRFVQQSVGRTIVGKSSRFTSSQVKSLVVHAKNRYRMRSTARLQAAAKLESTAEDVAAKLQAAGVELPPSTGYSTLPPAPSYQDSRAGTDASAPGTASVSEAREQTIQSYVRCGVSRLREEATELEEMSTNKHLYVAQSLAMRILRSVRQITTPLIISEWRNEARKAYNQKMRRSRGRVETLRTLAEEWEKRLASGALAHEDPDEGTSGKRKRQRASGTETTTGRPCARPVPLAGRQCERQRKQAARQSVISEAPRAPSMISSSQADQTEGSLRGTVLGSRVELPGLGSVPYVKLAIDKLRLDAALLRRKWGDEEKYMKGRIAENMHEENNRMPVPAVLSRWIRRARHKQHCRRRMRLQESADYDKLATEIERRAVADGILLQSGPASPLHGAECADVLEATEFEEGSGGPRASGRGPAEVTFAHLAIENRRHQAEAIDATWGHGEEKFVAEHVAYHMVRRNQPSPDLRTLQVWTASARTSYRSRARARQAKASQLKAQADALEQELRDLLSSTPSRAAEPARESASTAFSLLGSLTASGYTVTHDAA